MHKAESVSSGDRTAPRLSPSKTVLFGLMALLFAWIFVEILLHLLTLVHILPRNLIVTPAIYTRSTVKYQFDANGSPIFVDGTKAYRQIGIPLQTRQLDADGYYPVDVERFGSPQRKVGFFGDSYVAGLQVKDSETFPRVLEQLLQEANEDVACLNFGIGGTGTYHQYLRYLTTADQTALDDVVLCFFPQNDVLNNHQQLGKAFELPQVPYLLRQGETFVETQPEQDVTAINERLGLLRATIGNSFVGSGLYRTLKLIRTDAKQRKAGVWESREIWLGVYGEPVSQEWQDAWAITEEVLIRLARATEERGSNLIVLLVADSLQIFDAALLAPDVAASCDFEYPNRRLTAFCAEQGITCLDSLPFFLERKEGLEYPYFSWEHDGHYSQLGHRTMAEFLASTRYFGQVE